MFFKIRFSILCLILFTLSQVFVTAQENQPTLRPIQKDGKWGYIDKTGKIILEPQFYWVEEFSEGLSSFETEDSKHGYINGTAIKIDPKGWVLKTE